MGKYDPLTAVLAAHAGPEWRASFAEIEAVLGFALPKAARSAQAWWANGAWSETGWDAAEVDRAGGLVTFSGDALAKTYRSAARRAGGALVDVNGAPITHLYDLRHSFGTAMYRKTGDLATVGRFLGHAKNSPLTARYAMGAERDVDLDAAAAMSDVFRPAQRKARREQRRLAAVPRRRTAA